MARIHQISGNERWSLRSGWEFAASPPGALTCPADAMQSPLVWQAAVVPGTVASSLRALGKFRYAQDKYDESDYWFRCALQLPNADPLLLHVDGIATLAELYWNDELLLRSDNMFRSYTLDLSSLVPDGQLWLCCRALQTALAVKKPRPRWRTRLVDQQQLRWQRTTLLGRIPPWSPPVAPVGPFRDLTLESCGSLLVNHADVRTQLLGNLGLVRAKISLLIPAGQLPIRVHLRVGDYTKQLMGHAEASGLFVASGELRLDDPPIWWPHTHGEQPLVDVAIHVEHGGRTTQIDLGCTGFRKLEVDRHEDAFTLILNDTPIFCRGACWTPIDIVGLNNDQSLLRQTLTLAKEAGMNMLRIGGTMIYETDDFYRCCDELGILVWQDFMFANMDYPVIDEEFLASVTAEAQQFLNRTQLSPCLAVFCGNSEVEQQAAMLGLGKELWSNAFFGETLPTLCAQVRADPVYCPSSPSGGTLPFQVDASVSHYYGVGAYLKPLTDARRSDVRFTSECLGFSHVPEEVTIEGLLKDGELPYHHPAWKARVPRDAGPGWDFEDIRDHYATELFGINAMQLRYTDMPRYLAVARVTTGEVVGQTLTEWRRVGSRCQGALIWWLRDLWAGAGWGLIDSEGRPKAAYYYAKRSLAAVALLFTNEGLNGLEIHALNDSAIDRLGDLEITLYRRGEVSVANSKTSLIVPARTGIKVRLDALFEHFLDTAYAYRFGPPGHDVVTAVWRHGEDILGRAFAFPAGMVFPQLKDLGLQATATPNQDGSWQLAVHTTLFAQAVAIDVRDFTPSDNYFHLAPGSSISVTLVPTGNKPRPQGSLLPLNATTLTKMVVVVAA